MDTEYQKYFVPKSWDRFRALLDCSRLFARHHNVIIYVGRKVAHVLNIGLGRCLNPNQNGHAVVAILRIAFTILGQIEVGLWRRKQMWEYSVIQQCAKDPLHNQ